MPINDSAILFASLAGSKVAESIDRFGEIQNQLNKQVIPPIPIVPFKEVNKADIPTDNQFFPLKFIHDDIDKERIEQKEVNTSTGKEKKEPTTFTFPYEPIISIKGKNNLIKRKVAKVAADINNQQKKNYTGSVTERWSQDDWEITITGVLIGENEIGAYHNCYPKDDVEKLLTFFKAPKRIQVECEPLQLLGIQRIIIKDIELPFTKGENMQAYIIKAYSDSNIETLKIE